MWINNDEQFINFFYNWKPAFFCPIVNPFGINKALVDYSISSKSGDEDVESEVDIILNDNSFDNSNPEELLNEDLFQNQTENLDSLITKEI